MDKYHPSSLERKDESNHPSSLVRDADKVRQDTYNDYIVVPEKPVKSSIHAG